MARIVHVDHGAEELEDRVHDKDVELQGLKMQVEDMQRRAEATCGRVDMYVSNAARRLHKTFFDTTNEDWHFFLNQQLTASWYLAKAFVPAMQAAGWGRIIHINGPDGYSGGWTRIPHSTAKGALRTLTKSLAAGLGEYGITVNDVNPGFMDTVRDYTTPPGVTPEFSAQRAREILSGLEQDELARGGRPTVTGSARAPVEQLPLFAAPAGTEERLAARLRAVDVDRCTPIEALTLLAELKKDVES